MDEHQVVQVCYQFKHGLAFMTLTTHHLLNNMALADTCCFRVQTQDHFDSVFNWYNLDFVLIALEVNSMGAHYNPASVSTSIVN